MCIYRRILCKEVNALNKVFEAIASWWEWMVSIAMNFQFKDAVDIIIVAFLIYGVVKLVRETRAGQLVKGLFLLVILFIISSYFNLVMVSRCWRISSSSLLSQSSSCFSRKSARRSSKWAATTSDNLLRLW